MSRSLLVAPVLAIGATLAACTQPSAPADLAAAHSSGLATTSVATTTSGPAKSQRGNIIKAVGQPGGLCADDACTSFVVTFTVDKIDTAVRCTEPYAPKPQNGHFIAVSVTVKTAATLTAEQGQALGLGPYDFTIVGPDGITENTGFTAGHGCIKEGLMFPSGPWSPASQYGGVVMLDSKHTSGVLVLRFAGTGSNVGWEWSF